MRRRYLWVFVILPVSLLWTVPVSGAPAEGADDGFVPMFNGRDLSGWINVNCAPSTFFVRDGEIVTTGHPTGFLRTGRQYENFVAEFDWMHVNRTAMGNSGFFVWADALPAIGTPYTRGIEVQVLVNHERAGYYTSDGDLFSIHGATCRPDRPHPQGWARCLPSEKRCKGGGEWNHYKVIANDGVLKLHVNGKEVSGLGACRPRKGYLALESEGAECHFRNLRIKELPSTHPRPEETATLAEGFEKLFTGLDLSGWKADASSAASWHPNDWILRHQGPGRSSLRTERVFGDAEFVLDFHFPRQNGGESTCGVAFRAAHGDGREVALRLQASGPGWHRLRATLKEGVLRWRFDGKDEERKAVIQPLARGPLVLNAAGDVELGNLFVRELGK